MTTRQTSSGQTPVNSILASLVCTDCRAPLKAEEAGLACPRCTAKYPENDSHIVNLLSKNDKALPPAYYSDEFERSQKVLYDSYDYFTDGADVFRKIHFAGHEKIHAWAQSFVSNSHQKNFKELDIGCGNGAHNDYYLGTNIIGIDFSNDSLKELRAKNQNISLLRASATRVPLTDNSIDIIYSVYSLEHIYQLKACLAEMYRILSPKGRFFMSIPCEGGFGYSLGRKVTSEPHFNKKGIDYKALIALEHCNNAKEIMNALADYFVIEKKHYYPFNFLPSVHFNLLYTAELRKKS